MIRWVWLLLLLPVAGLSQVCRSSCPDALRHSNDEIIYNWQNKHRTSLTARTPVTVNVVFHIVYNTVDENISDEQILSQLDILNEDFRLLNENQSLVTYPDFAAVMADMEINFQLATTDPNGLPTTGITRRLTNIPKIALKLSDGRRRICYTALGGTDAWCTDHYLNVWVGKFDEGFFAEASFPNQDTPEEDGIRIDPYRLGSTGTVIPPYHLGRTLTHELGHYFNLEHLWGSGSDDVSCTEDDGIADTPQQAFSYVGECPANFNLQSCGSIDQFPNFLNYTDDACMAMFTLGQKEKVWATINALRPGLKQPASCGMVATEDLIDQQISIQYTPNPARNQVEVLIQSSDIFEVNLQIFSLEGRKYHTFSFSNKELFRFDSSVLPAGIYFLKFNFSGFSVFRKLIILS